MGARDTQNTIRETPPGLDIGMIGGPGGDTTACDDFGAIEDLSPSEVALSQRVHRILGSPHCPAEGALRDPLQGQAV